MGERDWYQRYRTARDYADEQAEAYKRGDIIENWAYETDYKPGMPKPRKSRLTGAAWVAHTYDIAAENATTLTQVGVITFFRPIFPAKAPARSRTGLNERGSPVA